MTSRYLKLQEFAREIDCKLTKVRPDGYVMSAPYYLITKNGRTLAAFDLKQAAQLLDSEHKRQTGYWSKGHSDLMRNPMRD